MEVEKQRNAEIRQDQAEINLRLAACNQRLVDIIKEAGPLGQERQLRLANALMTQFNKRTRAYAAALLNIGDTFEEICKDARKSTDSQEGDVV